MGDSDEKQRERERAHCTTQRGASRCAPRYVRVRQVQQQSKEEATGEATEEEKRKPEWRTKSVPYNGATWRRQCACSNGSARRNPPAHSTIRIVSDYQWTPTPIRRVFVLFTAQ